MNLSNDLACVRKENKTLRAIIDRARAQAACVGDSIDNLKDIVWKYASQVTLDDVDTCPGADTHFSEPALKSKRVSASDEPESLQTQLAEPVVPAEGLSVGESMFLETQPGLLFSNVAC